MFQAQELSHPFTLVFAFYFTAMLHQFRRERQIVQERVEALLRISTEQGFALYLAWGTILRGWALAQQGEIEAGIAQLQQGLTASQTVGAEMMRSYSLALLAETYGKVGKIEEGLSLLTEALALVDKNEERNWEAELYRLKGELLLKDEGGRFVLSAVEGLQDELSPQACFLKAIEVARQQQAKSWELRATVSLCRLWQKQGRHEEARQMLAEIYGWFTEGFDTVDLKEAKALLEELSSNPGGG